MLPPVALEALSVKIVEMPVTSATTGVATTEQAPLLYMEAGKSRRGNAGKLPFTFDVLATPRPVLICKQQWYGSSMMKY